MRSPGDYSAVRERTYLREYESKVGEVKGQISFKMNISYRAVKAGTALWKQEINNKSRY